MVSTVWARSRRAAAAPLATRYKHRRPCVIVSAASTSKAAAVVTRPLNEPATAALRVLDKVSARASLAVSHDHAGTQGTPSQTLQLLEDVYEQLEETFYSRRGYLIPKRERAMVDATGGSATYGEVMPEGLEGMIKKLHLDKDSVFVDLGSGLGRAAMQVALTSQAGKVVGIELSASRHDQATWIQEQLQETHGLKLDHVELIEGDITTCSYQGGTHFLLCSTAFSASGCKMIAGRLAETPSFQVLVTSRQLPPAPSLRKVGEFPCAYSWNLGGTAHVYTRADLMRAPAEVLAEFLSKPGMAWLPNAHAFHVPIAVEESVLASDAPSA